MEQFKLIEHDLTEDTYYTNQSSWKYLSASQYKDFAGCIGRPGCEAMAMAKLKGEWQTTPSTAMLMGSYIDAYIEGTLDAFKEKHPEVFLKNGKDLKAEYKKTEDAIKVIEQDAFFMGTLSGHKQVIMTGEVCGMPVKIKMDSFIPEEPYGCIVDLKYIAEITKSLYVQDHGRLNFVDAWGYDLQLALYREVVRQNIGRELVCLISAVDKQAVPDHEVIEIEPFKLTRAMMEIEAAIPRIDALKKGEAEPVRCGVCDYCRSTKRLDGIIPSSALLGD